VARRPVLVTSEVRTFFFYTAVPGEMHQGEASIDAGFVTIRDSGASSPSNDHLEMAWSVTGGGGADTLVDCPAGCGLLDGGAGVHGGTGKDVLHGQVGHDRLSAKDGLRDNVGGGRGFDRANVDRGLDLLDEIERVFF
jgi:Ca2+-binding RTX toxin-like protein